MLSRKVPALAAVCLMTQTACSVTRTIGLLQQPKPKPTVVIDTSCELFTKLSYEWPGDTLATVSGIREHNAVYTDRC